MNSNQSSFFNANGYFIDEKVNLFKFANAYKVFNENGENIGAVRQKLTTGQKLLRLVLNKQMLPFKLEIVNDKEEVQTIISRGWTFWMSKIIIENGNSEKVASIRQKFKLFKPTFHIYDNDERLIGTITGDWKAWNFLIADADQKPIGKISKKWAGAIKEVFTSADKYYVEIDPSYKTKAENKMSILSSAITIDMVLKESK